MADPRLPSEDKFQGGHRLEMDDPRNMPDFLLNLLHPGWNVVWASDGAQRRHEEWAETKGLRCPGCGTRLLIASEDSVMHPPEWWWDPAVPNRPLDMPHPYCDDCEPKPAPEPSKLPPPPV